MGSGSRGGGGGGGKAGRAHREDGGAPRPGKASGAGGGAPAVARVRREQHRLQQKAAATSSSPKAAAATPRRDSATPHGSPLASSAQQQQQRAVTSAPKARQHGATPTQVAALLLAELPTDLGDIYSRTVGVFAPAFRPVAKPTVLRAPDSANLLFRVDSRQQAEALFRRLDKAVVYGRRWRAHFAPASATVPRPSPTAVDVFMSGDAPLPAPQVEAVLSTIPGLLAVAEGDSPNECLATFADEGTALHARAVLSGRKQDGCHLFLNVRRDLAAAAAGVPGGDDGDDDSDDSGPPPTDSDDADA